MSCFQNCLCLLILVVIRCKDLEGVNFPNLKVLKLFRTWQLLGFSCAHYLSEDIVVRGIDGVALLEAIDLCSIDRFISTTELPENLEELKMPMSSDQCPVVTVLKKLRAMEISLEKANFDIPPNLEQLTIHCVVDIGYSEPRLPRTIQKQSMIGGKSSIFD